MELDWLKDGRKIPDSVMYYIRAMAVHAVRELGQSPETVAKTYNFNRACIYRWLRQYDEGGYDALKSKMPPGSKPVVNYYVENWLKRTVLNDTPVNYGYDTNLWTCKILSELLAQELGISVDVSTIRLHLKKLNLSFQKPEYQDIERDEQEIHDFLNDKFIRIQRLQKELERRLVFKMNLELE